MSRAENEQQHHRHFHKYNNIIDRRGFANADHEQERHDGNDDDRWQIEDRRHLRSVRQREECPARRR